MLTPTHFYARSFGLIAVAVLSYLLFRVLSPFFIPLLWGALLAFLLQPLNQRLIGRWKRPALAAATITTLVALVVLGPVSVFVFSFVHQASELYSRFQAQAQDRKLPALQLLLELGPVQAVLMKVEEFTALSKAELLAQATDAAQSVLQRVATMGGSVVLSVFGVVTEFGLTLFVLFFLVRDGREMLTRGLRLVPMSAERKADLGQNLGAVTRGVVLGTLATALVQGTLIGVGFAIAGLPSPVVFGAVGALASLVPMVGTTLVWVPAVLTLFAQGETKMGIFLAAWSIGPVTLSDNIVRTMVVSGASKASTLLVFVGVLGGISAFGFSGLFVGPVLLTLVAALMRYADESELGQLPPTSVGEAAARPSS